MVTFHREVGSKKRDGCAAPFWNNARSNNVMSHTYHTAATVISHSHTLHACAAKLFADVAFINGNGCFVGNKRNSVSL